MTNAPGQKISGVSLKIQKVMSVHGYAVVNVAAGTCFIGVYDKIGTKVSDTKRIIVQ